MAIREEGSRVRELVNEALRPSGSKQRYLGVVGDCDRSSGVGSTTFVTSGEKQFLAWTRDITQKHLHPGQLITFRLDGLRVKDIEKYEETQNEQSSTTTSTSATRGD